MVNFNKNKSSKYNVVCSTLSMPDKRGGSCKCHLQFDQSTTNQSTDHRATNETFKTTRGLLNCSSKYIAYLMKYKVRTSCFPYTRCAEKPLGSKNFKSVHCKFRNAFFNNKSTMGLKQQKFHRHFCQEGHSGIDD